MTSPGAPAAPNLLRIVLRQSPDWRNTPYDELIENSRAFSRLIADQVNLPANFIGDAIALWDATLNIPFFRVRAMMTDIARENIAGVKRASVVPSNGGAQCFGTCDVGVFIDDDDWLHPEMCALLEPHLREDGDGYVYGNVLCTSGIELRPLTVTCYTNNYAVSGWFLNGLKGDLLSVEQHWDADRTFHTPPFRCTCVPLYLSATNKHPASTMKLKDGLANEALSLFALRRLIERYLDESARAQVPTEAAWVQPYLHKTWQVFAALL